MKEFGKSLILICSLHLIICLTIFSQTKPVSIKFDEYSEESGANLKLLAEKTKRFAKHLRKLPKSTKGVIIYYTNVHEADCCSKTKSIAEQRNDYVRNLLTNKYKISPARVVSKPSAYRYFSEIEFWHQPKNAEIPTDTPNANADFFCPIISIEGDEVIIDKNKTVSFLAKYAGGNQEVVFNWSVSTGRIIKGQGTGIIEVDLTETNSKEIEIVLSLRDCCFELLCTPASFKAKIEN